VKSEFATVSLFSALYSAGTAERNKD
jgi:hypothetical protein